MQARGLDPELSLKIDAILDPLLGGRSRVALFDFPNHSNVGDSAIWLGETDYLRRRHPGIEIVWASDLSVAANTALPALPPDCTVLIHGGGNFGDLWPRHHRHREEVVRHYPQHRIVQLPQTVHFESPDAAEASRAVFGTHPGLHLLVRDRRSLAIAQALYGGSVQLCPDMAIHLLQWPRPTAASVEVLGLLRTDKEAAAATGSGAWPAAWPRVDWLDEPPSATIAVDHMLTRLTRRQLGCGRLAIALRRQVYERLALERMHRGCRQLARGQVVVTDRLHAHLLCCLMGIPHVVLDNSYGKISSLRAVWQTGDGLCVPAASMEEAVEAATMLLKTRGNS